MGRMRQCALQRGYEGMRQRVEVPAQHAVGLRRRVTEFTRHQQCVERALGAGAHAQHRIHEGLDDVAQQLRPAGVDGRLEAGQSLVDGGAPAFEYRLEQLVFLAVVVTHQCQRHAGLVGDLPDRDRVVTTLGEQFFGRQQDRLPAVGTRFGFAIGGKTRGSRGAQGCEHAVIERSYKFVVHPYKP